MRGKQFITLTAGSIAMGHPLGANRARLIIGHTAGRAGSAVRIKEVGMATRVHLALPAWVAANHHPEARL